MFKFAGPELRQIGAGHKGQDDVGRKAFFKLLLNPERVCCVDEDACVLRCDDCLNDICKVVYIGKGFDAEKDIVESSLLTRCVFRALDDCKQVN